MNLFYFLPVNSTKTNRHRLQPGRDIYDAIPNFTGATVASESVAISDFFNVK